MSFARAILSYRVCAVSFNSEVEADMALAALGTTQLNASRSVDATDWWRCSEKER
jgi:hypothetical protein